MATTPKRTVKRASRAKAAKAEEPAKKPAGRGEAQGREASGRGRARAGDALVIVESPTKAKTIGKYLGRGYDVKATVGHLRDLPTRELGVDVDNGFEPKYVTIKGKTKTLAELKKAAKAASTIYLATDPDREGEAIAWHVADQITPSQRVPVHRVLFEEITSDAVLAAMEEPTRSTSRRSTPSRPAGSSTGWWATRRARSCGAPSRPDSPPAGCRRSRSV